MKPFARNLRRNQTDAERKMWRHLKNRASSGFKFRRQCPIGPYIVDFVCLEKMIVIEIDGGQHAVHIQKDTQRTKNLEMRGYRVMRFWNNEVLTNTDSVLDVILTTLVNSPSSLSLLPLGEGNESSDIVGHVKVTLYHRERGG
jgi:very-short-patch-repair endonuclease